MKGVNNGVLQEAYRKLRKSEELEGYERKALEVLNARFAQKDLNDHNLPAILQALAGLAISEPQDTTHKDPKGIDKKLY